jgi:hypothetical protein
MSDHIVYISRNRMEVLNLQTGVAANGTAEFTSIRILIGNYPVAEELLAELMRATKSKSLFARASRLIIQPMEMTEGGLCLIEQRAFEQLGARAGALDARVHVRQKLTQDAAVALLS